MDKVKTAREWLLFLSCFFFGLFIMPNLIYLFFIIFKKYSPKYGILNNYKDFLAIPFERQVPKEEFWIFLTVLFGPYVLIQLIRSIIWSIKIIKRS